MPQEFARTELDAVEVELLPAPEALGLAGVLAQNSHTSQNLRTALRAWNCSAPAGPGRDHRAPAEPRPTGIGVNAAFAIRAATIDSSANAMACQVPPSVGP